MAKQRFATTSTAYLRGNTIDVEVIRTSLDYIYNRSSTRRRVNMKPRSKEMNLPKDITTMFCSQSNTGQYFCRSGEYHIYIYI